MQFSSNDPARGPAETNLTEQLGGVASSGGQGDFRGPYGFGRPAYRPDPGASYDFKPQRRTLPVTYRVF